MYSAHKYLFIANLQRHDQESPTSSQWYNPFLTETGRLQQHCDNLLLTLPVSISFSLLILLSRFILSTINSSQEVFFASFCLLHFPKPTRFWSFFHQLQFCCHSLFLKFHLPSMVVRNLHQSSCLTF